MQRNTPGAVWWDGTSNQLKSWNGTADVDLSENVTVAHIESAGVEETATAVAPLLTQDHEGLVVRAYGSNASLSTQDILFEMDLGGGYQTILDPNVPGSAQWFWEAVVVRASSAYWTASLRCQYNTVALATRLTGTQNLGTQAIGFRVNAGSASGHVDALLIDKRRV